MFAWIKALFGNPGTRGTGARGEELAARHLRRQAGYRIVATNWRSPQDRRDELDLVALDGETLVFVEVKTRASAALVPGYHAVDARKKRVVERAARVYLRGLTSPPRTVRFDIVEVALPAAGTQTEPVVRHFINVPLFPKPFRPGA